MSEYQWKTVSVVGFDELMAALYYADRKGFMPDAIRANWEAFNWESEQPAQQKAPPEQWMERWYGSGPERGWWIVCGRDHIAHLGPSEFAEEAASKIVNAHNRYKPAALQKEHEQPAQQEPVAWMMPDGKTVDKWGLQFYKGQEGIPLYTRPQAREPLTGEQCEDAIRTSGLWPLACVTPQNKALLIGLCRAAHGIKGEA